MYKQPNNLTSHISKNMYNDSEHLHEATKQGSSQRP